MINMKGNEYYLLKNFSEKYWTTHRMMGPTSDTETRRKAQGKKKEDTKSPILKHFVNLFGGCFDWEDIFIVWGERDYAYRFTEEQANAIKEGLPKLRLRVEKK